MLCLVFTDTYGLFNFLIPGPSFYSTIEASSLLVSKLLLMIDQFGNLLLFFYLFQPMHS